MKMTEAMKKVDTYRDELVAKKIGDCTKHVHGDYYAVTYYNDEKLVYVTFRGRSKKADFRTYSHAPSIYNMMKDGQIRDYDGYAEKDRKEKAGHILQVGDILKHSWGWEQTNIDYYQVVALKGKKKVLLREVDKSVEYSKINGHVDSMIGTCKPIKDAFIGEAFEKVGKHDHVSLSYGNGYLKEDINAVDNWTAYA